MQAILMQYGERIPVLKFGNVYRSSKKMENFVLLILTPHEKAN
jgi:hypothetical protein